MSVTCQNCRHAVPVNAPTTRAVCPKCRAQYEIAWMGPVNTSPIPEITGYLPPKK